MRTRSWGDEHLLFDEVAGDTHLLPTAAFSLLDLIRHHGAIRMDQLIALSASAHHGKHIGVEAPSTGSLVEAMIGLRLIELDTE
jgi:PqqD family protein of HPr-rel-A system